MLGTKHLIQCHCVLPQFRKMEEPIFHKFVVYSKFEDNDRIEKKIVRCNNCDAVHRVIDLCKSEIVLRVEDTDVIIDEEEIKLGLPERLVKILEKNNSDLPTFEAVDDIINNEAWGSEVVISRKSLDIEKTHLKILEIKGPEKFRLKSESINIVTEI